MERGFTLLEMTVATSVLALTLAVGIPAARRSLDRMAVVGAREGLVGMVVRARSEAIAHGGATLILDPTHTRARIVTQAGTPDSLDLAAGFGVSLETGSTDREARLDFDALGIGRIASHTVRLRRGVAEAAIVVSAYGRVTRR
jgi:prepilin-type N-terminal cleavage/methylation domain-containing protein